MKIISININDFGGIDNHREEYKKIYGNRTYLKEWDKLNKLENINGILECIIQHTPDIVILQEYDINSTEAQVFYQEMCAQGYLLKSEMSTMKRPSMTVMYIKESIDFNEIYVEHERNLRAYAIKTEDIIIYGTHIPPKYDKQFWNELHNFIRKNDSEKYILLGDFNTINYKNSKELDILLKNAVDVWKEKGNNKLLSVAGDYVIVSKKINVKNIELDIFDESKTDHPVILVTIV